MRHTNEHANEWMRENGYASASGSANASARADRMPCSDANALEDKGSAELC